MRMDATTNTTPAREPLYASYSDALLRHALREATRRARTARGPSAAQAADRTAARLRAELAARGTR